MGIISVKVRTDGVAALKHTFSASKSPAEHALAVQVAKDTEQYVPMRTGLLVSRTRVIANKIIYAGPSAHMLYRGKVMVDSRTGKGPMKIVDKNGNEFIRFRKGATLKPTNRDLNISTAVHPKAQSHWVEASKAQNLEKWEKVAAEAIKREL